MTLKSTSQPRRTGLKKSIAQKTPAVAEKKTKETIEKDREKAAVIKNRKAFLVDTVNWHDFEELRLSKTASNIQLVANIWLLIVHQVNSMFTQEYERVNLWPLTVLKAKDSDYKNGKNRNLQYSSVEPIRLVLQELCNCQFMTKFLTLIQKFLIKINTKRF